MNVLKNEKGFTLIELVLIIVILGILGAVATVQFGTLIADANKAALDGSAGPYSAQLALAVNSLKAVPTCAEFLTEVDAKVSVSGGKVTTIPGVCAGPLVTVTFRITAGSCEDVWTYDDSTGSFTGVQTRTDC